MYGTKYMCCSPETGIDEKDFYRLPAVDVFETEKGFTLLVNMPGVKKENVKVQMEDQYLNISGIVEKSVPEDRKYLIREIRSGNYHRRFKVSETIDTENIQASYENGVLTIDLVKKSEEQPKVINIK